MKIFSNKCKIVILFFFGLVQFQMISAQYLVRELPDNKVVDKGFFIKGLAEEVKMEKIDSEKLFNEGLKNKQAGIEVDFVFEHKVELSLKNSTSFKSNKNGESWKTKISSPGALAMSVNFDDFFIPEGAALYIYSEDGKIVQGPISSRLNRTSKKFYNEPIAGESIIFEYFEPNNVKQKGSLNISKVYHNYNKEEFDPNYKAIDLEANCLDGWCVQKRSVCRIKKPNGGWVCTATMLNNSEEDFTPYVLTAKHCFGNIYNAHPPEDLSYVFHHIKDACENGSYNYNAFVIYLGAELMSEAISDNCELVPGEINTDFYLLKLLNYDATSNIDRLSGIHFAGWSREYNSSNKPNVVVALHHEGGGSMEYSLAGAYAPNSYTGSIKSNSYVSNSCILQGMDSPYCNESFACDDLETVWAVRYGQGSTSNGSSGCALFGPNGRAIGQLLGSQATYYDFYPRISKSWDIVPNDPNHNLKAHLDPNDLDPLFIDAICPTIIYHNQTIDSNSPSLYTATHTMELAGNIEDVNYDGIGHIPSNNIPFNVQVNAVVEYKAGNSICMLPGVKVESGSVFLANISSFDCADGLDYDFYQTGPGSTKTDGFDSRNEIEKSAIEDVSIFPNPSKGSTNLELYISQDSNISISVFDIHGKNIMNVISNEFYQKGQQQFNIDCSAILAGTYFCTIKINEEIHNRKLIILE